MRRTLLAAATLAAATGLATTAVGHDDDGPRRCGPTRTWTTVFTPPAGVGIEGLTADKRGDLYAPGRVTGAPCPVFKAGTGVVGNLPAPCNPAGLAFGPDGRLYIADSGKIMVLRAERPDAADGRGLRRGRPGLQRRGVGRARRPVGVRRRHGAGPRVADRPRPRAGGDVPRAADGQRRAPRRRRPRRARAAARDDHDHRDRAAPPRTRSARRHIVANGLAFGRDGTLFVADTARGAIWRVFLDRRGRVLSRTGCDTTFTANTLCLDNVLVQHPYLDGADGIVLDGEDNIFVAANERNAIAVVTEKGRRGRALPQPGRRGPAAQRGPARVPDQPGAGGQAAVHDELRHRAA